MYCIRAVMLTSLSVQACHPPSRKKRNFPSPVPQPHSLSFAPRGFSLVRRGIGHVRRSEEGGEGFALPLDHPVGEI